MTLPTFLSPTHLRTHSPYFVTTQKVLSLPFHNHVIPPSYVLYLFTIHSVLVHYFFSRALNKYWTSTEQLLNK